MKELVLLAVALKAAAPFRAATVGAPAGSPTALSSQTQFRALIYSDFH